MAKRARLTPARVVRILKNRLALRDAQFMFETARGGNVFGDIVSPSFRGMRSRQRLDMLRRVLREELTPEEQQQVGMIITYTPEEWNIDDLILGLPIPKKTKKKAG